MLHFIKNTIGCIGIFMVAWLLSIGLSTPALAQKATNDSLKIAREKQNEARRKAQQHTIDSTRKVRAQYNDSLKLVRKKEADKRAALRAYRESKKYKDSVTHVRQKRLDSIKAQRVAYNDSIRKERQHQIDSVRQSRKIIMDSTKAVQQKRADSLATIRKYKESKRYKDSVAISRQTRLDSVRQVRQAYNDSLRSVRKAAIDSAAAVRKQINDSLATVRKKRSDSLAVVKKAREERMAKRKAEQEKLAKAQEKKKQDKIDLAIKLSIEKKHKAWNNEKMLKKKWSLPRRVIQNTFTRYNYYFNANKKMDEALLNMQRARKEDYDSTITLFLFDPNKDSTKMVADMDSIIQKASLGIQIHDPRTKWGDDLYLLLGQAFYFKGDYENADAAFKYIISINQQRKKEALKNAAKKQKKIDKEVSIVEKENNRFFDFIKHRSVNNDAILWLTRTYVDAGRENDAESILDLLESDKNTTEKSKGRIAIEKAYLSLKQGKERNVGEHLTTIMEDDQLQKWIRLRAAYLNGQLQYAQKNYVDAATAFQKVIDLKPKIDMDFYARKNLAYSKLQQPDNSAEALHDFKALLSDGKYAPYYEQVYYVLGQLAANSNDLETAITYLQKSTSSPKSTKKQKAISFSSLGNVYYTKGDYRNAKIAYDSAAVFSKHALNDPLVAVAIRRAGVLDKVAYPSQVIREQDSLLALSQKTEKEQREIIRRYIKSLEKARTDSIVRAENQPLSGAPTPQEPDNNGGGTTAWYFTNTTLMQQGFNEFKRKWGNRSNVDNWWLLSKAGAQLSGGNSASPNEEEPIIGFDENGIPTELSLLAQIPSTPAQKDAAKAKIQKAYVSLSDAYINDLADYPSAQQTLDTFDKRFPENDYQAEVLYQRYLLAMHQNNLPLAQSYSERLQKDFSKTKWATLVSPKANTNTTATPANSAAAAIFYEQTYEVMMQRDYPNLLYRAQEGQRQYATPAYTNKFKIMEAIALAGTGKLDDADTIIAQYVVAHPNDSLLTWAIAVSNYIKRSRAALLPKDSTSAMKVNVLTQPKQMAKIDTATLKEATAIAPKPVAAAPTAYTYKPQSAHAFVFYYYQAESKVMGLKVGLQDYNSFTYSQMKLKTQMEMLRQDQGIIYVEGFSNAAAAKNYRTAVIGQKKLLSEFKPAEYQTLIISNDNLLKLKADRDITSYLEFYKKNYK